MAGVGVQFGHRQPYLAGYASSIFPTAVSKSRILV
jgi:hypothetical protein